MASWYAIRARATGAEVAIYDEIGACGVSAKGFLAELGSLPEGAPIDLRVNSPGGSVFDAVAIHNALKRHEGTVTVWIDGIAASAASYVAMAGDEIVMPENAFLMIHDPAGLAMGTAADMRAMAEALDKVAGSLAAGYAAKSGRSLDEIAALMAAETWLDAREALALGFADRLIEPVRIAARFDVARFRNAPPGLVKAAEADWPNGDAARESESAPEAEARPVPDDADSDEVAPTCGIAPDDPAAAAGGHVGDDDMPCSRTTDPPAGAAPPDTDLAAPDGSAPRDALQHAASASDPALEPSDSAAIRAEVFAHARAVVDLCRLAGRPQSAGRFLEEDASLDAVRAALLAARAEAEPEIAGHHAQPGRPTTTRPWGEIVARTFKLKG